MSKMIRLDKFLCDALGITRSQAKQYIKKGRVSVDSVMAKKPEQKVDSDCAMVMVDGKPCVYEEFIYLMLNKPAGVVSATVDKRERTVLDLVDCRGRDIFPVGRLDKDTEGLLLLTDDGRLAHQLLSPKKHVDKSYYAVIDKELGQEDILSVKNGLDIGDEKKTLPATLEILGPCAQEVPKSSTQDVLESDAQDIKDDCGQDVPTDCAQGVPSGINQDVPKPYGQEMSDGFDSAYAVRITIQEGRYHQVKRMMHALGAEVLYLKRERMGSLVLDPDLDLGDYRPLTKEEINQLYKC